MITRETTDGIAILRIAHGKVNALDTEALEALSAWRPGREPCVSHPTG